MALRAEDLKDQRAGLTEDIDGSGGETEGNALAPEDSKAHKVAVRAATSQISHPFMPCMFITGLLVTFGALALGILYVVTAAFDPERLHEATPRSATAILSNSSR